MIDPADIQVQIEEERAFSADEIILNLTQEEASLVWWALQFVKFAPPAHACHDKSFEVAYHKCMELTR